MGGNARAFYGVEGKLFVTEEPDPIERPAWYPQGEELEEFARLVAHPRENADELKARGMNGILAVNSGSAQPPAFVAMKYSAPGATRA